MAKRSCVWCRVRKVMCLVRNQIFLLFVILVVCLFQIRRGRVSCWVSGLTVSSHERLLSCRRPVILGRHYVVLHSERARLSSACWILIQMVVWGRLIASLCFFRRLLLFLPRNWDDFFVDWCVVVRFRRCDSNSQRPLISACLQLKADFCYTSSYNGFRKVYLFAFWSLFGEIWSSVVSPELIQEEFGYLWCSSEHRLYWSQRIGQGWKPRACPDWFQCCLWQG